MPGLRLITDFVSAAEEQNLLTCVSSANWDRLARRDVCHFGFAFDYVVRPCPSIVANHGMHFVAC